MAKLASAATGAVSGAAAGSAFGPIGTGIGAVVGGLGGYFGANSGAKKDKNIQNSLQTPEQQNYLQNIFQQLGLNGQTGQNYGLSQGYLQKMLSGDQGAYDQWAQPYNTQFQEQTLPGIAERFAGLGGGLGGGALGSSGFAQALGGAATQHSSNLAGLYAQLQQQAAQQAMGQYNTLGNLGLNTRGFETQYQPGQIGLVGRVAEQGLQGLSSTFGKGIGNTISEKIASMMNPAKQQTTGTETAATQ
jgi:hypothetical protein